MIKECRLTSSVRRGKIAQSTNKSLVHHGLNVVFRLRNISLIIRIIRIISVVEAKIITLILIVRFIGICRIVRLVVVLTVSVVQSLPTNSFEVSVFPAVMAITLLSTAFVAVLVESLTISFLVFSLICFRSDARIAVEALKIVWILLSV